MIFRIVLFKLDDAHEAQRDRWADEDRSALVALDARVGLPADDEARRSWDVCWNLQAPDLAEMDALVVSASYTSALAAASARAIVVKAWSFETGSVETRSFEAPPRVGR